jgi:hypothetical protein
MSKEIIIHRLDKNKEIFKIVPLSLNRKWMNDTNKKFAYKCLPLNIANQYGWAVLSPANFSVSWYGGSGKEQVEVFSSDPDFLESIIVSHFGEATFTLQLDFVIQTPENYSLYIRGVPNEINSTIRPLDAIVETDWLPFTFSYNYKFAETGTVDFKRGDPLFVFFPIERNSVENFKLKQINIEDNQDLYQDFLDYSDSRISFNKDQNDNKFQRFYQDGRGPKKEYSIKNHLKRLFFGQDNGKID